MLDWSSRLDDLYHYVASIYQISDTGAIDILLAALLPVPRTPAVWLIIETNWYSRFCDSAWFSFGEWHVASSVSGRDPQHAAAEGQRTHQRVAE